MVTQPDPVVKRWLFAFCGVVAVLIVFGGFVRLTRSGLSIVEWEPVTGVVPPLGDAAWDEVFAEYQQSPEYLTVNTHMTMSEFQRIFLIEWVHRLVARLAGFAYAIPLAVFALRGRIPRRDLPVYVVMGSLFVLQAVAGWLMVASGLEDRPAVDHLNLTVHLLLAFTLLGIAIWTSLDHHRGRARPVGGPAWTPQAKATTVLLAAVAIQVTYGGLTAGLKAGHVADTWPTMSGHLIPDGMFGNAGDLIDTPLTVMFIHRWFAFVVAAAALAVLGLVHRARCSAPVRRSATWLSAIVAAQIALGVVTVISSVNEGIALAHQATAIAVFATAVALLHAQRAEAWLTTGDHDLESTDTYLG